MFEGMQNGSKDGGYMIESLAGVISGKLCEVLPFTESEKEKLNYGVILFIELVLDIIGFLIIGTAFNCLGLMAIFLATFAWVRAHAGGYHAKTFLSCLLSISAMALVAVAITRTWTGFDVLYIEMNGLAAVGIILMAPLGSAEKPIGKKLRQKCKLKTIVYTLVAFAVSLILYKLQWYKQSHMISLAIVCQMLTMVPIYIKLKGGK